jgi:site-specific recombinase XerD
MKTTSETPKVQQLIHVGDCLYRSSITETYYGIFKRDNRQVKRSLRTTDRELAKRRLEELRRKVNRLTGDDAKTLPFTEYRRDDKTGEITSDLIGGLAKRWLDATTVSIKSKTVGMYVNSIKMLGKHFGSMTVRSITLAQVEQWAARRSAECSARTFNADLEVLRRILDYACKHGMMLENPAREITRRKLSHEKIIIPTKDQFRKLLDTMRQNNGKDSADLVEFLAYSGCRLTEVVGDPNHHKEPLTWGDINLELKTFTVTGKGRGDAGKTRTVPLFPPLERLLLTFKAKLPGEPQATAPVFQIHSAMTSIMHACKKLGLPKYNHHVMRHFFCSNCIEAGVDFKVIAGWLGHVDGGILVAKTYGHLRDQHSAAMAKRITFDATAETPANVVPMKQAANG